MAENENVYHDKKDSPIHYVIHGHEISCYKLKKRVKVKHTVSFHLIVFFSVFKKFVKNFVSEIL